MKVERQQALGVGPYQRGEARRGQANGFKPKQLKTRVGPLNLQCRSSGRIVLSESSRTRFT